MSTINQYVLYIIYLFIGRFVLAYVAIIGFRITSLRISASIRLNYLEALFQQPISLLDALPPGQTTAIVTVTANILQLGISERLSSLIQAFTVILTALTIGCIFSWELTLVTASGLVAIVVWYSIMTPLVAKKYAVIQEVERGAAGVAHETLSSIRMIAACGAEGKMKDRYDTFIGRSSALGRELSPLLAIQHSPVFFTIYATFALCFWYAVRLYLNFAFANVETLVVVLMSAMTMLAHINAVSVPLTAASNAIDAASIFFTVIDAPKPVTGGVQDDKVSLNEDLFVEGISFAYPTRHEVKILIDVSFVIPRGKTTAIVGPSGSGKSTIVALIQRWYELGGTDPTTNYLRNGSIRIGPTNLNEIDLHWWRAQIGLVQQDSFLFNDTIFKNVEYGLVGTEFEFAPLEERRELVEQACKEAYADDFIRLLPEGYSTPVGDVGIQLSGGQRQRIAIARAIVRRPKLLVFDEATSALDVASERIVQQALERVAQNRTTIVIAHRLSTIKRADKILVLLKGRVVQQGTHDSLLEEKDGVYWKLVHAQEVVVGDHGVTKERLVDEKESQETLIESEVTLVDEAEARPPKSKAKSITRSFGMLLAGQKQNWIGYLTIVVAAMGAASSNPIQAFLFARLISSFSYWGGKLLTANTFLCIMLVTVATGIGLSYFILGWVSNTISVRTITTYRKEYFQNIISKRISFFDIAEHSIGILTARIATDPAQLQQLLGINMAMVLISLFSLIGCITIAVLFHWKFALVVIGSSMPIILAGGWYRVRHEVRFESRNNEVFAESARFATEAIGAIRTVACLTLERAICRRYDGLLKAHITKSWKEARVSGIVFAASDSLVLLCMAFALWYGGLLLSKLHITPFNFLVVYLAIIQGSLAAGQWLSFGPNIAQVSVAADRIQAMRVRDSDDDDDAITAKYNEANRYTLPASLLWKGADIEFRNVWFKYETRNVPVLQGLNLRIQHGQFAALVGSSGSGKTTVISLLERFYEPQRGAIYYNSENITSIPLRNLRKRMSLVAQEPYLIRGTVRENVLLGMDSSAVSDSMLHTACRDAGIHAFITSLPSGYDTEIATSGVTLSGGQKQRLSIARALIRDPSVLLLDEATSSLDSETEKEVQAVFEETGKGRTMVVVAHRLATVQNADVIFVMRNGRVVERGNHQELLGRRGGYWEMCQAQALGT
ncbi:ABC multidrug transporter-like protein [Lentithecium fluviatile CBS 122367]|uniref:ABC multidrug transporter-like protein n=1 Tax=Lentithecium fluviatile CBS 122367 TaxID=1168545 RepID=A0A6G1ILA2_9PLEO|nr:ABC multidrug transporter-like protein [Lentithecium fluviatile CBS 122367]